MRKNTTNALLCIELVDENRLAEFENALKDLAKAVEDNLGGICKISILDINNKKVLIK